MPLQQLTDTATRIAAMPACELTGQDLLGDAARRAVLAKAAEVRRVRSDLARRLAAGLLRLSDLLGEAQNDYTIGETKVLTVLEELPEVGKVQARRAMERIGIEKNCRLAGLGASKRTELIDTFG